MFRWIVAFCLLLGVALLAMGCSKGPAAEQAKQDTANANQPVPVHLQPTTKGDIERISLAISIARDSARANKWHEAAARLRDARKEVDTALGRKPRLREEFEALKAAIDRAIPVVESGGHEAEAQLQELQTRIGAIKVNTF